MQVSLSTDKVSRIRRHQVECLLLFVLAVLIVVPEIRALWATWRTDPSLSHGPLVPVIAIGLLWMEQERLRCWKSACLGGLAFVVFCAGVYVGSVWADIDFLRPLSLIGMILGSFWYLGGPEVLRASIGAIGFLIFMIPWPTVLIDRIAFPLQVTSTAYAALFAGILGLPIHREGVQLFVLPDPNARPIYSIVVAKACSGLTSLMVLLALAYLIAYHTPLKIGWRMLLVALVVPLTLFMNAVRLTVILLAGAYYNAALAKWIHDHEGPVLIFLCSIGLMSLRYALLSWTQPRALSKGNTVASFPISDLK